jgi:hypothetical protein
MKMYIVTFRNSLLAAYGINKFETIGEAKEFVGELYRSGHREVYLSQEIPMKVTVNVEF